MKAYRHWDDGAQWLRIVTDAAEWDEPMLGWYEVHNLSTGKASYRHLDGREIKAM